MQKKRKVIGALVLIVLISVIFIAGYTFARYYKSIDAGSGTIPAGGNEMVRKIYRQTLTFTLLCATLEVDIR